MFFLIFVLLVVVLAWIGDRQLLKRQYQKNWQDVQVWYKKLKTTEQELFSSQAKCQMLETQLEFEKSSRRYEWKFVENQWKLVQIDNLEATCKAGKDGDCNYQFCPQERDNEPATTGRPCPWWNYHQDRKSKFS